MFQQLPTAGLPFQFETWEQFEAYTADMLHTGVIDQVDEIRWDMRPSPRLRHAGDADLRRRRRTSPRCWRSPRSSTAWSSTSRPCSTRAGSCPRLPPWFVQENKWRSARYGMDAIIILDAAGTRSSSPTPSRSCSRTLEPTAERLGCTEELAGSAPSCARAPPTSASARSPGATAASWTPWSASLVAEMRAGKPL